MKRNLYPVVAGTILTGCLLWGCSDSIDSPDNGMTGRIAPRAVIDGEVVGSPNQSRADEKFTEKNLYLKITSEDGKFSKKWTYITEFDPEEEKFPVGKYLVEAGVGDDKAEGFDQLAYYGSAAVIVQEGITTPVSITATMPKSMISVSYTDNFKKYMTSYSSEVKSSTGKYLYLNGSETRPVYFMPGPTELSVEFTKPNGKTGKAMINTFNAEARHHYKYTIDMDEQAGDAGIKVEFDDTMVQEDIEIDISDAALDAPAPTINFDGFDSQNTFAAVETFEPMTTLGVGIVARGGLAKLEMSTSSTTLAAKGWPVSVDLLNMTESEKSRLEGLDFIGRNLKQSEKMAGVELTNVVKNMVYIKEKDEHLSYFTFKVTDRYMKTAEVTVKIDIKELIIAISNPSVIKMGDDRIGLEMEYNAPRVTDDFGIFYVDENGVERKLKIEDAKLIGGSSTRYSLVLSGLPKDEKAVTLKGRSGNKASEEITVTRSAPDFTLAVNENDVFAKYAIVSLVCETFDATKLAPLAKFYVGADKRELKATVVESNRIKIEGLTPGVANAVCASCDNNTENVCPVLNITTEAALQIPNSDMETWSRVDGKTQYWWIEYPGASKADAVWATLNELTTSEGGSTLNMFSHKGTSYCAFSGTRKTTDVHGGSLAAVIETVGYGDNDALGTTSGRGCQKIAAGELFLGSYNNGANYSGYAFASRPSAVEFWYKYRPKNSADYGYAEIRILNSDGQEITETIKRNLPKADAYQKVNIPVTYLSLKNGKATRIMISFKSSGNQECLKINDNNLDCPKFSNLSDGRLTGSSLYIDDINLIY